MCMMYEDRRKTGGYEFIDSVEQIVDIIKGPAKIIDGGSVRYYIRQINGKWVALVVE
jgi:hypothetical protein